MNKDMEKEEDSEMSMGTDMETSYSEHYAYDESFDDATLMNGSNNKNDSTFDKHLPAVANYIMQTGTLEGTTLNEGESGLDPENRELDVNSIRREDPSVAHLKQLKYNQNKILLDRAINSTIALFTEFKENNIKSPIYYPIEQMISNGHDSKLNSISSKRALLLQDGGTATYNKFDILKIDLKMGNNKLLKNLDDSAISMLVDEKFSHIIHHLKNLRARVDDISSKVLITGDLNSGKSSFCNALLRRNIMPVDQQPCTNVFCEIIDYHENNIIEEVHAIPIGSLYNIKNQNTYNIFPVQKLEDLVYENDKYSLLKVYIDDNRTVEESLLKNGVVDIRLIDAPGLNLDSYQTMQLFSRQEEIDLVIFVVNAENHFTLSGREFISNVNNDKKFSFIVVNKFDSIKRKDKCVEKIMQQVGDLSPETHKDSNNFVHFVSSLDVLNSKNTGPGGDPGDDPDGPDGSSDENRPRNPDFDRLEASLRNFVLDKRSVSKLLPAKNYLSKIFKETLQLIDINISNYNETKDELNKELNEIKPKYDEIVKKSIKANEKIMQIIDGTSDLVYSTTRKNINRTIDSFVEVTDFDSSVTLFNIDQFIQTTKLKVVHNILTSIEDSEDFARLKTLNSINDIRSLGKKILGEDKLSEHKFKPESMYSHKRDQQLKNHININFELLDLIDFDSIVGFFKNVQSIFDFTNLSKFTSMKNDDLSIGTVLSSNVFKTGISSIVILYGPRIISVFTGVSSIIKLPKIITVSSILLLLGYPVYYIIKESPKTVHKNIIKKIKSNLVEDDYIHLNSVRISKEVRKVLNYPAKDVSVGLNGLIEKESNLKMKLVSRVNILKSNLAFLYGIKEQVEVQKDIVNGFELEVD